MLTQNADGIGIPAVLSGFQKAIIFQQYAFIIRPNINKILNFCPTILGFFNLFTNKMGLFESPKKLNLYAAALLQSMPSFHLIFYLIIKGLKISVDGRSWFGSWLFCYVNQRFINQCIVWRWCGSMGPWPTMTSGLQSVNMLQHRRSHDRFISSDVTTIYKNVWDPVRSPP